MIFNQNNIEIKKDKGIEEQIKKETKTEQEQSKYGIRAPKWYDIKNKIRAWREKKLYKFWWTLCFKRNFRYTKEEWQMKRLKIPWLEFLGRWRESQSKESWR